jgi:hypothetical protein
VEYILNKGWNWGVHALFLKRWSIDFDAKMERLRSYTSVGPFYWVPHSSCGTEEVFKEIGNVLRVLL